MTEPTMPEISNSAKHIKETYYEDEKGRTRPKLDISWQVGL